MAKNQFFIFQMVIQLDLTIYLVAIGLQYLQFGKHEFIADTIAGISVISAQLRLPEICTFQGKLLLLLSYSLAN